MAITEFRNKVVVVTGAAAGIGRATALAFAREGAAIVAADLRAEALGPVVQEVEGLGVRCMPYAVNVADEAAMRAFAEAVQAQLGAPHVLINNAGIGYFGLFLQSDLEHWRRVMDVNLMGVVHGCHAFLPLMLVAGGPRNLLNVASPSGLVPSPSMGAYAASKGAVYSFTEVLKLELHDSNVHVSTVFPGVTNTAIVRNKANVSPSFTDAALARIDNFYETKGCSPEVIARDMLKAVMRDSDMVLSGPNAAMAYHMRRVSLKLVRAVVRDFSRKAGFL